MMNDKKGISVNGWKYYNHAAIPTCAPHENPDLKPIKNGSIWKLGGGHYSPLLARWTTDWDCGYETNWWYVIKDTPFDINALKSKRRYEITKGLKNFRVERLLQPEKYSEQIFNVASKAFSVYPEKYRPRLDKTRFITDIQNNWKELSVFGAFNKDNSNKGNEESQDNIPANNTENDSENNGQDNNSGRLCGYACLDDHETHSDFIILKVDPDEERNNINFALIYSILLEYNQKLQKTGFYICDGSRAIRHQTHFQDYLEKYFGFRKSYCLLHIKYRWWIFLLVNTLKPLYSIISKIDSNFAHNIVSILLMDNYKKR